jgi:hypothetical protein
MGTEDETVAGISIEAQDAQRLSSPMSEHRGRSPRRCEDAALREPRVLGRST